MDLSAGLDEMKKDVEGWDFTVCLEREGRSMSELIREHGSNPPPGALERAYGFLIAIEKWKAGCLQERMGMAATNPMRMVWTALKEAVEATTDRDALLAIMNLRGFGASVDEDSGRRRAKLATSVLRFLAPDDWGVVDWRTAAMLGYLHATGDHVDKAIDMAKAQEAQELRRLFDLIDESAACEINQQYRSRRSPAQFPRTADVELAIFGLSVIAWPWPVKAN